MTEPPASTSPAPSPAAPDGRASKPPARDPHALPDVSALALAVLGGTGPQGRGLARRWAMTGHRVALGSREAARAAAAAAEVGHGVAGGANADVAAAADVVVAAVPWEGHADLLALLRDQLAGKILVDCVNPLGFDRQGAFALRVAEGSAAEQAAALLPDTRVVAAFHHVSAVQLLDEGRAEVDTDVLVLGDDRDATDTVQALAARIPGVRGVYAGRLRNAGQVEALTATLISTNRRYRSHAGLRVTDVFR